MPRSPNYPDMGLDEAVDRIQRFWETYKQSPITPELAVKGLGYKGLNGRSRQKLSAVRKYGLLDKVGTDYRLSELAMRVLHPVDPGERDVALVEAASKIKLFAELSERYPDAPDEAVRPYLLRQQFSERGVNAVIAAWRGTMRATEGLGSGYNGDSEDDISEEPDTHMNPPDDRQLKDKPDDERKESVNHDQFVIDVSGGGAAMRLEYPLPLSDKMWSNVDGIIQAIKSIATTSRTTSSGDQDGDEA